VTAVLARPAAGLDQLAGVHELVVDGNRVSCQVDTAVLGTVLARLGESGIQTLESRPPTLEELFLRHYTAVAADAGGAAAT
jgi:ABC-2 type transport system ATP-binding protein